MQTNDYTKATLTEWQRIVLFLPLIISMASFGFLYAITFIDDSAPAYINCHRGNGCFIDAGSQPYYYYTNSIFLLSALALLIFEYLWLDLKNKKIRQIMMWIMFLNSTGLILLQIIPTSVLLLAYDFILASVPIVLGLTFLGQQPSLSWGRLTPIWMTILGFIWNLNYLANLT